jgi:type IV secretory pathway protease TraF
MKREWILATAVLVLSGAIGSAQQPTASNAVLVRDSQNVLSVSTVVAGPGDTVSVSDGQVIVNGNATAVRVQLAGQWGPQVLDAKTYFVAGDPALLGSNVRAWGMVVKERIVGTVHLGQLPSR